MEAMAGIKRRKERNCELRWEFWLAREVIRDSCSVFSVSGVADTANG